MPSKKGTMRNVSFFFCVQKSLSSRDAPKTRTQQKVSLNCINLVIFIDPPYNIGNDFVCNDKFAMNKKGRNIAERVCDENGKPLQENNHSPDRCHEHLIYTRLFHFSFLKNMPC